MLVGNACRSSTGCSSDGADVQAHGSFDSQAHAHSPELWVSQHRGLLAAGALAAASAVAVRAAR